MNYIKKYVLLSMCLFIITFFISACTSNKITPEVNTKSNDTKETNEEYIATEEVINVVKTCNDCNSVLFYSTDK